jgi:hypothetical protein
MCIFVSKGARHEAQDARQKPCVKIFGLNVINHLPGLTGFDSMRGGM